MSELKVKIIELEPLRVASALGFGPNPEEQAWRQIGEWAKDQGLLENYKSHRFFGFNNPSPAPGSPNYGYEQWMTLDGDFKPAGAVKELEFPGGRYAVARCRLENITATWKQLVLWRETSPYTGGPHQWLEECLTPEVFLENRSPEEQLEAIFDLYMPITG